MAHFAEIDKNNKVLRVIVINNSDLLDNDGNESEDIGRQFCSDLLGGVWVQTSYNTRANVHLLQGTPFRKNYAGAGMLYDSFRDAFILPKPYESWNLNEDTCQWEPPTPMPTEGFWAWNEDSLTWIEIEKFL